MTGTEFRQWRRSLEVTQQMVADYCHCNKSTICRFEKSQIELLPHLAEKLIEFKNHYK
jgi:predicted transcriptional regulator|nr:MAG TPA: Regulatory protein [Caudoviricetes sp.]